jgi:hypothetical protein
MVAELIDQEHPIVACADQITTALSEVVDVQPVCMSLDDKRTALLQLTRAERQLAELKLRVLAAAKDVADEDGAHRHPVGAGGGRDGGRCGLDRAGAQSS